MATDRSNRVTEDMKVLTEESKKIQDSLNALIGSGVGIPELIEQLDNLKEKVSSKVHVDAIQQTTDELKQMSDEQIKSSDVDTIIDETADKFSTNMSSKIDIIKTSLDGLTKQNKLMSSGFSSFRSFFSEAFSPFEEIAGLLGGMFGILRGGFGYLSALPMMIKSLKSNLLKSPSNPKETIKTQTTALKIADKQDPTDEQELKATKGITQFLKKEDKEEDRERKKKESGGLSGLFANIFGESIAELTGRFVSKLGIALMAIPIAIGAVAGGFIRSFTLPFELLGKGLNKIIPLFKWLDSIFIKVITLLDKTKSGSKLLGQVSKIIGWFGKLSQQAGFLGKLVGGLVKGFKVLGWPITLLLGVVDFIKGFTKEQGSLVDKFKTGLISAVGGFFELPAKFIGGVVDKTLGLFNVQIKGGFASKIKDSFKWLINNFVNTFSFAFEGIAKFLKGVIDFFKPSNILSNMSNFANILSNPGKAFKSLFEMPGKIWNWLSSTISDGFSSLMSSITDKGGMISIITKIISDILMFPKKIWDGVSSTISDGFAGLISSIANREGGSTITKIISDILMFPKKIWDWVSSTISRGFQSLLEGLRVDKDTSKHFSSVLSTILMFPKKIWGGVGSFVTSGFNKMMSFITGGKDKQEKKPIIEEVISTLLIIPEKIGEGIRSIVPSWDDIKKKFSGALSFLPGFDGEEDVPKPKSVKSQGIAGDVQEVKREQERKNKVKEIETQKQLNDKYDKMNKNLENISSKLDEVKESNKKSNQPERRTPDEIENLSLFLHNKNGGI